MDVITAIETRRAVKHYDSNHRMTEEEVEKLMALAMGYESCPMDGFDFAEVGSLINLPEDHIIAMFVAIGKGIKEPWPRGGSINKKEAVITERF